MHTDYSEKYITIGLKIAYYRKKALMTQENLAEKADISLNHLACIEAPGIVQGVSLEALFRLADALKVPVSKLLEDD